MDCLTTGNELWNSCETGKTETLLDFTKEELEPRYFTTLEHIEKIIEYAEAIGINSVLLQKAQPRINIVADRLAITPMQTVLFSLLFGSYNNKSMDHDDLAKLLRCTPIKLLHYMNDLEELQKKKLVEVKLGRENSVFRIPMEVVNTLRKKDEFVREARKDISIDEFFGVLEELFDQLEDDEISCETLRKEVLELVENNAQLLFCRKIMSFNFSSEAAVILLCFCHLYVNNQDDNIGFHDIEFLYDKKSRARMAYREFRDGDHILVDAKFVENTEDDGFVNRESFRLTDKAKKELLVELNLKEFKARGSKGLTLWDSIPQKKLFYNKEEAGRIAELGSLLQEENFGKIRKRLEDHSMRRGFACLFSGGPGTGKTETVYQIARETQRNIMAVDISSIKGMYVGETEKHMKAVFDNYRNSVSASGRAPILFFNEADAVIGKRIEFTGSSRAVDRMENTMQNIILQEMENLDGILIATTNLTKNMDGAFDRRFLYKIEFEKPNPAARASIWFSMLPELPRADTETLASRFDLSGGQIENVVRRFTVDAVLTGIEPSLETLLPLCRDEARGKESRAIGFSPA
ncbi:MAG: ATP-binding protein [Treponema sp.]|jgi:hypothetical protein|nr:ATP-binding protein [Treponema sp.]